MPAGPDEPTPAPAGSAEPARDRLPRTVRAMEEGIAAGQHLGAQLYVSRNGEAVADAAFGESRPGTPMAADTLVLWMSMGKPVTAVLIARLVDAGRLDVDRPVAEVVPEFAQNGKAAITTAHLLTHTGGFRHVGSNWSSAPWPDVVARVCAVPIEEGWVVGETAGYHMASSWYILAEVARRILGDEDPREMYRREVFEPLGMADCWIGMPRHRWVDYGTRVGLMYDTSKRRERGLHPLAFPNSEAGSTLCRPGGNGRGPLSQLGRFYEALLAARGGDGNTPALPSEDTARTFTSRRLLARPDVTFNADIDWGYGFLLNTGDGRRFPYDYGPHASPQTFGHSGNQSSCAFADPRHGLVVCWATNGMPGELAHQRRQRAMNQAVYEDLGLARAAAS